MPGTRLGSKAAFFSFRRPRTAQVASDLTVAKPASLRGAAAYPTLLSAQAEERRTELSGACKDLLLLQVAPEYASVAAREASLRAVTKIEQQEVDAASAAKDAVQELRGISAQALQK